MWINVSVEIDGDMVPLVVTLSGDGEVEWVERAFGHDLTEAEMDQIDMKELAEEARASMNARLRGWP